MYGTGFGGSRDGNISGYQTAKHALTAGIFEEILFSMEEVTCNPFTQSLCTCSYSNLVHHTENSKNNATWGSNNVFEIKSNGDLVSSVVLIYLFKALQAATPAAGPTNNMFPVISTPGCPLTSEDNDAIQSVGGLGDFLESLGADRNGANVTSTNAPCTAGGNYASYCPYIGIFAAHATHLKCGENTVDAFSGASYLATHELIGDVESRAHTTWGGTNLENAIDLSETDMFAYVKTQFTLTADLSSSLALCASLYTKTEIHLDMRKTNEVIVRGDDSVEVQVRGKPISSQDIDIGLDIMYIILDDEMRAMYQNTQFEVIITRTIAQHQTKSQGKATMDMNLSSKGFLLGMFVLCQRAVAVKKNLLSNFEGAVNFPPLNAMQLSFDGQVYHHAEGERFRKGHTHALQDFNVPTQSFYAMAFSPMMAQNLKPNHPGKHTISSGVNANVIDDLTLTLDFQPALVNETVNVTVLSQQLTFGQYKNGQLRIFTSS